MSKKIIAICGSPRREKSRTAQLTRELLAAAGAAGASTGLRDVTQPGVGPCLACDRCHHLGRCAQTDGFNQVFEELLAAAGIVLASPVYIHQVSAQLKLFIDRFPSHVHCQRLLGRYGAVVVTAGGSGHEETADYLEDFLQRVGVQCVGRLACALEDGPVEDGDLLRQAAELGRELAEAIAEQKQFPEQVRRIDARRAYFRELMEERKDRWPWEYRYWREKWCL